MADRYVHGYATAEQERLLRQAEHWREELILSGTSLAPGTRLLEVGCGVGAVLGVLGRAFPDVALTGVDIEERQLDVARRHLADLGVDAALLQADAVDLPYPDKLVRPRVDNVAPRARARPARRAPRGPTRA